MKIYCDGAATMKKIGDEYQRQAGGWAWAEFSEDGECVVSNSGNEPNTTNNRMELMAVYQALVHYNGQKNIILHCDSAYVINIFTNWITNWERNNWTRGKKHEPIENIDLIKDIYNLIKNNMVTFVKVSGHSSDSCNNFVDQLAVVAKQKL